MENQPDLPNPWANPIFKDVEAFLTRIQTFVDIFESCHVAIPKRGSAKFVKEIKKHGFEMTPFTEVNPDMLNRNDYKKLNFFSITRSKSENR